MKKLILFILFLFFNTISAQNEMDAFIQDLVIETKKQYPSDPKDLKINKIFDTFYLEVLQSENGEISEDLIQQITVLADDPKTKNMHLLSLLLVFQEYINESSENEQLANAAFQLKLIDRLENEFKLLNQPIPLLIYIYKIEALQANDYFEQADELTALAYKKNPNSVPIKVYQYLATNDESIKNDLIKNHSNHWFVKQLLLDTY